MKRKRFNLRPNVQEDFTRIRQAIYAHAANDKLYIHDGFGSIQDQVREPKNRTGIRHALHDSPDNGTVEKIY